MYKPARTRALLEERLESIISGAALMADSSCTRDERRERIVKQCNAVRQALQDLLTEYENNVCVLYVLYLTARNGISPYLLSIVTTTTIKLKCVFRKHYSKRVIAQNLI